jgi:hypothetical protein
MQNVKTLGKEAPWTESASELYRPNDRRRMTDPCGHILVFLDRSRYLFFQVSPQLGGGEGEREREREREKKVGEW